jgi:hypothetical protein
MRKGWVIGIAALVAVGGGGYFAADHFANAKVREQAQIFARDMRKVTKEFRYGAVRADLLAQSIVMTDVEFVTLDGDRIKAASVAVKDFDWRNGGTPRYADIEIKRAQVPSTALTSLARASKQLGSIIGVSTGPAADAQLPYLYGPILNGIQRVAHKAWLQPCLHDEVYAYLPQVADIIYAAQRLFLTLLAKCSSLCVSMVDIFLPKVELLV